MTVFSKQHLGRRPKCLAVTFGAYFLLAACAPPDPILPGVREDVRSVLQSNGSAAENLGPGANVARGISLPAAKVNTAWTHGTGTPTYRVAHAALSTAPQLAWSANIGAGDSRKQRITATPVVADGRVFTLDAGSVVTATSTSGAPLWSRDIRPERDADGDATGGGLAVSDGTVYISSGFGVLVALDASSGAPVWSQQLDATGSGTPTVSGNLVYLTAGDDSGWAVNKSDGRIVWQLSASGSLNNVLGAPAPAISSDLAIFGFGSGEVQAVFRKGGLNRWDATVLGERPGRALSNIIDLTGAPVISGTTVYVGNQSGRIAALDVNSGARKWTAREGTAGPVWPAGDSIFVLTDLNELVRLDANDGSRIWGVGLPNFVKDRPRRRAEVFTHHGPILAGGRVIVTSNDGFMRSYDPTDGSLTATTAIPGGATTAPVVAGRTLYVVSRSGQLHAFR